MYLNWWKSRLRLSNLYPRNDRDCGPKRNEETMKKLLLILTILLFTVPAIAAYIVGESEKVYESGNSNQVVHAVVIWQNPNLRVE